MKRSHLYPFSVKVVEYGPGDLEYEVKFYDFAEVIGVGDTVEEAIEEAYTNLDAFIADSEAKHKALPEPSKIKKTESYSGKITVRLPKSLHRDLSEYAIMDGMSINSLAIDAFRKYLSLEAKKC